MAVVPRRYQFVGPPNAQLTQYVGASASQLTLWPNPIVDLQVDNAVADGIAGLDAYMASIGWTQNASAPSGGPVAVRTTAISTVLTIDDDYLLCSAGPINVTLPTPAVKKVYYIKDTSGGSETNAITLVRFAAEQIEGLAASRDLRNNFGTWHVLSDGTNWWLV